MNASARMNHAWRFFRAGGLDQVKLDNAADLAALAQLDKKLWVALSCPTKGLEFDGKTLELIDTDKDGRIRVPELLAAVAWTVANLRDPSTLFAGTSELALANINDATPEGQSLLASARQILANLGKPDAAAVTIADTTDTARIFAQTRFNGDGVIPPHSSDDPTVRAVIADIVACLGGAPDRSGQAGVSQAMLDRFFADLQGFSDWRSAAEKGADTIMPLGEATPVALDALKAVRAKIGDYFTRCRFVAYDERAGKILNRSEADIAAVAGKDLSHAPEDLGAFPLATVAAGKPLPLAEGLNPAWASAMATFRALVVTPLLGSEKRTLTETEWADVNVPFAAHEAWLAGKAGASVEKLGIARVREILAGTARNAISELIAGDKALEPQMNAIAAVDRLAHYHRDLFALLNNFVAFRDFYAGEQRAIFQAGTLFIDGRSCDLCVRVEEMGRHTTLAGLSKTYLLYCDCTRRGSTEKMVIAAGITGGDADNLMVGRNGVFFDRKGQDWDATVSKIVENPISVRQAILMPYKRIGAMIGAQIEKIASAREKAVQEKAAATIVQAGETVQKPASKAAPPAAGGIGNTVGILAAIGLALGALGTALAAGLKTFFALSWWQMPLAVLGVLILISGPSMVIAWLKLRQRNIGPILDANGWAINGRAKISIAFGGSLTKLAHLPPNAVRDWQDFGEDTGKSKTRWGWIGVGVLALGALVAWAILRWGHVWF